MKLSLYDEHLLHLKDTRLFDYLQVHLPLLMRKLVSMAWNVRFMSNGEIKGEKGESWRSSVDLMKVSHIKWLRIAAMLVEGNLTL